MLSWASMSLPIIGTLVDRGRLARAPSGQRAGDMEVASGSGAIRVVRLDETPVRSHSLRVEGTTRGAVLSPDGRWLWFVGSTPERDYLLLATTDSLDAVGEVSLPNQYSEHGDESDIAGDEVELRVHPACPSGLVLFSNGGDSFTHISAFQADASGIQGPSPHALFEAVSPLLDETLRQAQFVSPNHLVVVDDIGVAYLLDWPACEVRAHRSILESFEDDDGRSVFPDAPPPEYLGAGWSVHVTGGLLLVELVVEEPQEPYVLVLMALDRLALEPRGLVTLPAQRFFELRQIGESRFAAREREGWTELELTPNL